MSGYNNYRSNGALGSVSVSDGRSRHVTFVNGADGEAIKRTEADYASGRSLRAQIGRRIRDLPEESRINGFFGEDR